MNQNIFKPFLVESCRGGNNKNIFRVVNVTGGVTRKQIERLLEMLPIDFQLRRDYLMNKGNINEPLEVYVCGLVVYIYPPRHRVIVCTTFDSWKSADVVSKMRIDNVMDMLFPGYNQVRTCVHFDPKIFGIEKWPDTKDLLEIEIDIHVYPKSKTQEPKFDAPPLDIEKLLKLIAGGDQQLTAEQLGEWRELIMYAVKRMRSCYENPDVPEDDSARVYYKPVWEKIDAARSDEELIEALNYLLVSIQYK